MKIYKYKDNVDTDVIIPARYLNSFDAKELASHAAALNQDLSIQSCDSIQQAVREAKKEADKNKNKDKIILFGTLSLIHEIYQEVL